MARETPPPFMSNAISNFHFFEPFPNEVGGHYGLGGQIIKNAKGHKKLRQRAQNSGKTQDMI